VVGREVRVWVWCGRREMSLVRESAGDHQIAEALQASPPISVWDFFVCGVLPPHS